jgi:hypothetical protein
MVRITIAIFFCIEPWLSYTGICRESDRAGRLCTKARRIYSRVHSKLACGDEMGTGRAVRYFKAVHRPVGRSAPARRILRTVCSTAISTAVTYVIYVFLYILVCSL